MALIAEYSHGLGLRTLVDRYLPVPGSLRGYAPSVFVESVVLLLAAGGRHLEDLRDLEREAALLKRVDADTIPDPDRVGDWLRRMGDPRRGQAGLVGLGAVRDVITARLLRRDEMSEYTLDADAMQVEAGKREAHWTYQKVQGYMPMLGFLFESGLCLVDEFREGNVVLLGANAVFFRLGVLAYNLFMGFKRLACPAAWARHTIATVRWKRVQIAGRIVRHAGQVILTLGVDAETWALCRSIRRGTFALLPAT